MNSMQARNAYRQTQAQSKIHPVKLIHMMYERALVHLQMAEEGIVQKSPKVRGENLSKAIAIITELNASVKDDDSSEAAQFLRGLYGAILVELPKVAVSGDVQVLRQAAVYIKKLNQIWEQTAMREMEEAAGKPKGASEQTTDNSKKMYGGAEQKSGAQGVSFSI